MANKIVLQTKSNKQIVKKSQEDLRHKVPKVAKSRMRQAVLDLKKRMSKPGKAVKYPVPWDSFAQKIKVIIMLRKRGTLPYVRRRRMQKGWVMESIPTGYKLENHVRGNKYVYGDIRGQGQSAIEAGRWPLLRREADIVIKALPQGMQRAMVALAKVVVTDAKGNKVT